MNDVLADAKQQGFDTKVIRHIIARRKRDAEEVAREDAILELYLNAIDNN